MRIKLNRKNKKKKWKYNIHKKKWVESDCSGSVWVKQSDGRGDEWSAALDRKSYTVKTLCHYVSGAIFSKEEEEVGSLIAYNIPVYCLVF